MHAWSYRYLVLLGIPISIFCSVLIPPGAAQSDAHQKWIAPAAEAQKKNPIPVDDASLSAGKKVYVKRCASCHGNTGNGDGPDAVDLGIHPARFVDPGTLEDTDGALFWKVSVGRKPMPDYGRKLSPTERWSVINYIRTLARK